MNEQTDFGFTETWWTDNPRDTAQQQNTSKNKVNFSNPLLFPWRACVEYMAWLIHARHTAVTDSQA